MVNTLENKLKLYAQYWGQKVLNFKGSTGLITINQFYLKKQYSKQYWLELTRLSQITDEDAIEVAKIYCAKNSGKSIVFCLDSNVCTTSLPHCDWEVLDYLRSKGYALPWMGISVEQQVEYGWVKLIK